MVYEETMYGITAALTIPFEMEAKPVVDELNRVIAVADKIEKEVFGSDDLGSVEG